MGKEIFNRTLSKHRRLISALTPSATPINIPYEDFEHFTIYKSPEIEPPYPTLLYIPGNGFIAKETAYTHLICTNIAKFAHCQVIVIKHRFSPEFKFPIALQDCYKTIKSLLRFTLKSPFDIDKSRVAIGGYSSGGNLAALITILLKEKDLIYQLLISPIIDLSRSLKEFEEFQEKDTAVTEQFVEWFINFYVPKNIDKKNPIISPYWLKGDYLKGLPPTDIIFGEFDRFRSDSDAHGKKLTEQGNLVNCFMFQKENHGLLWHNISVIEAIATRLFLFFKNEPITRSLITLQVCDSNASCQQEKNSNATEHKLRKKMNNNTNKKLITPLFNRLRCCFQYPYPLKHQEKNLKTIKSTLIKKTNKCAK